MLCVTAHFSKIKSCIVLLCLLGDFSGTTRCDFEYAPFGKVDQMNFSDFFVIFNSGNRIVEFPDAK